MATVSDDDGVETADPLRPDSVATDRVQTYWAFISYRHLDNRQSGREWATWLHRRLESYEIPSKFRGHANSRGDVIPERIYPVFRDEVK